MVDTKQARPAPCVLQSTPATPHHHDPHDHCSRSRHATSRRYRTAHPHRRRGGGVYRRAADLGGRAFFTSAGLLTGGTAGLAFLLHYATGIGFGKIFFVLNLPFYWLALRKLGRAFTIKTFAAVLLLSVLTELQTQFLQFSHLQPLYAAIAGGLITGTGFLVLFRHRCSLGGVGILALYLQDRYGWRAGKVQMAVDCCIVLLALWSVEPLRVAWSIAGAVALNLVLAMNHRPGRYMAV